MSSDIESDANVAIFNTSNVANLSTVTRLDAVGFGTNTGGICDLLREGTTLPPLTAAHSNTVTYVMSVARKEIPRSLVYVRQVVQSLTRM